MLRRKIEQAIGTHESDHRRIESAEIMVAQVRIVHQGPLPSGIFVRPSVSRTREVDPFRMTEFIAHEIEVSPSAGRQGNQTDHLVESYATVHDQIFRSLRHRRVHLRPKQTEKDRLVADQSLVMALGIADSPLVGPLVGQFVPDLPRAPGLIRTLLDPLYPMVSDAHRHPEVETNSTFLIWWRKSGHSADILCYRESIGMNLVNQHVGKRKVGDGALVDSRVEIEVVSAEILAQTMIPVQHGSHSVEAETVQHVFLHPELAV